MKKYIVYFFVVIGSIANWYAILMVITAEWNLFNWHWFARLMLVLLSAGSISGLINKINEKLIK